jgi:hypothetical protein
MKTSLGKAGVHKTLHCISGRRGKAGPQDINVARIQEGMFRIMSSMIFNPRIKDAA